MTDERITKACADVFEAFKKVATSLVEKCGGKFWDTRAGWLYVARPLTPFDGHYAHVELCLDMGSTYDFNVRLQLRNPDSLEVGWGSNCLLTTNFDKDNEAQIKLVMFVAEVFRHEAEWRRILLELDLSKALDAMAQVEAEQEAEKAKFLKAYKDANIKVGTTFVTSRGGRMTVTKVFNNRVLMGKTPFSPLRIGEALCNGVWSIEN